eukprot:Selendium_serpulae@DN6433_c0_g1_i9.p1
MDDLTSTESIRRNQSSTPAPSSESRRHIISSNNRISSPQFAMVIPQSMNTRDVMSSSTSSVFTRCEMPNFSHPMLGRTIGFVVLKSAGTECEKILRNCALC